MSGSLDILGVGLSLPPARDARELVREANGDPEAHHGWGRVGIAKPDEHPSTFASAAVSAALAEAKVEPDQIDLVLAVGVSRDYLPSWCLAIEVMRAIGTSNRCFGFDLTVGCLGVLTGLNTALGWLRGIGGGRAVIVSAERWSQTIDRTDVSSAPFWAHADGGGAIVVGLDRGDRALATFRGAAFVNHKEFNGLVLQKYGGTRFPERPADAPRSRRELTVPNSEIRPAYHSGYSRAVAALRSMHSEPAWRVVCNQISPSIVKLIAEVCGVPHEHVCWSGHEHGHVGGADAIIGLRYFLDAGLEGPILVATSAPYAFGAGLVVPPGVATK